MSASIRVDDKQLQSAFKKLLKETGDARPAFLAVADDWYKQNKTIFTLKGPGKYIDLSEKYKKRKEKKAGFVYPILRGVNRRIEKGLTQKGEHNVNEMTKTTLTLGVQNIPYARRHQLGGGTMPARPFVFNAQTGGEHYKRQGERWLKIFTDITARRIKAVRG